MITLAVLALTFDILVTRADLEGRPSSALPASVVAYYAALGAALYTLLGGPIVSWPSFLCGAAAVIVAEGAMSLGSLALWLYYDLRRTGSWEREP
jgi:hypothetical protein